MSLLDILTGGKSGEATDAEQAALAALQGVQTPTQQQLSLPELQAYAKAQNMSPAQMQAFLQQTNALNAPIAQTGTDAQIAAINQLAGVANQGAQGNATEQAQESQIEQDMGRTLAGQRGAIDQAAEARGVPLGMLQAALAQENAGQDAQSANQAALQAQSQNYQTALNAMAQGAGAGQALQGQQNTQANTVGAAQNAMQQFNAANQQAANAANAGYQQQANATNTAAQNQIQQANTGLKNQQLEYNAQVPQTVFNDSLQKATGIANQNNQAAGVATGQGNTLGGIYGGLIGAGATAAGGPVGGLLASGAMEAPIGGAPPASANTQQYAPQGPGQSLNYAYGGEVPGMCEGGMSMKQGGMVPGHAKVPGNSPKNDTVPILASPGEAVVPRTAVQQDPGTVMRLLAQGRGQSVPPQATPSHHPQDVAALLAAMKHLRGGGQ